MKKAFIYSGEFRTFSQCFANHIETLGKPDLILWMDTSFIDFNIDFENKAGETYVPNVLRMWRRRYDVIDHIPNAEWVCLLRPDITIDRPISFETMQSDSKMLYIPSGGDYRDGINDQMAIGSSDAIRTYCNLYRTYQQYYDAGVMFHPETMLKHHLTYQGIEVRRMATENKIIR